MVAKLVATGVGVGVIVVGVAMLVLPGPGLVVMGIGLAVLATEWPWAMRVLTWVRVRLVAARETAFPKGGSPARRAAGAGAVLALGVLGFLATAATTAFLGATTLT
jgi:hypothetical protein